MLWLALLATLLGQVTAVVPDQTVLVGMEAAAPLSAKISIVVALRLIAIGLICLGGWFVFDHRWARSVPGGLILFGGVALFCGFVDFLI